MSLGKYLRRRRQLRRLRRPGGSRWTASTRPRRTRFAWRNLQQQHIEHGGRLCRLHARFSTEEASARVNALGDTSEEFAQRGAGEARRSGGGRHRARLADEPAFRRRPGRRRPRCSTMRPARRWTSWHIEMLLRGQYVTPRGMLALSLPFGQSMRWTALSMRSTIFSPASSNSCRGSRDEANPVRRSPPVRRTAPHTRRVYTELKSALMNGDFLPGQRLVVRQLAERAGNKPDAGSARRCGGW